MTGPIIFSNETARGHLLENGEVITFRPSERTTGETWWRKSRTGEKQDDVVVEKIRAVDPRDPHDLTPAQPYSGFESVPEWQSAIEELHGEMPEMGILYRTRLQDN